MGGSDAATLPAPSNTVGSWEQQSDVARQRPLVRIRLCDEPACNTDAPKNSDGSLIYWAEQGGNLGCFKMRLFLRGGGSCHHLGNQKAGLAARDSLRHVQPVTVVELFQPV